MNVQLMYLSNWPAGPQQLWEEADAATCGRRGCVQEFVTTGLQFLVNQNENSRTKQKVSIKRTR